MYYLINNCYGQWRELNSIFKNQTKHALINFVYDYPKEHLFVYTTLFITEFYKRGYKIENTDNMYNYFKNIDASFFYTIKNNSIVFYNKMNNRYLRECICNLEEKAICRKHN